MARLVQGQLRLLELIDRPRPPIPVLDELAHVLEEQIGDTVCAVMKVSDDGLRLRLVAAPSVPDGYRHALDGVAVGPSGGSCALAAFSKRPVIVEDIGRDPRWFDTQKSALAAGFQACWSVPIVSGGGELLGTLSTYHRRPTAPSSLHLGILSFAAMLARIVIDRDRSDREHERLGEAERLAERYRMVLQATRDTVWDWDLTTQIVLWNEGLRALGHQSAEVGAGPEWWLERIHPGDAERVRKSLAAALADPQRGSWEDEYRFQRGDGDYAEIEDCAVIARDRGGAAVRMVGSMRDITRHKRQTLEILRLAERLHSATAAANVGTWHLEVPNKEFHADASLNRLLGRAVRDTVEPLEEVLRLSPPEDRRELLHAQRETIDALRPFVVEHRVVLDGGAIRWWRNRGHALLDDRGRVQKIIGAVADITDLKRVEQSMALLADATRLLGESLERDQVIATIARMAVPSFADGTLVYLRNTETGALNLAATHAANPELRTLLEEIMRCRDYHVGVPAHRVLRSGRSERYASVTSEWLNSEDTDNRIIPLVSRFHVSSLILVPLVLEAAPIGVVLFFGTKPRRFSSADLLFAEELARRASQAMNNARLLLSAKRERARAEEAQSLRERLLDIVGHDLRTPLSAITACASLLERRGLASGEVGIVKRIESSATRMSRLIGQVLDFARIRQGKSLPLDLQPANLHDICLGVVEELRLGNPDREIGLEVRGNGEAICDADRVAEALSNLVGNAVQHGADGPVDVSVDAAATDRVEIAIHNNGSIPADAQASIFEPYHRQPTSGEAQRSRSVGLGLFIAKEIVQAHEGTISLSSTPERGTTFTVVLARNPLLRSGESP